MWLTFGDSATRDAEALGKLAQAAPRLEDRAWTCDSGALQVMDPDFATHYPGLWRAEAELPQGVTSDSVLGKFGIRDFGDMPYGAATGHAWRNGYWAMIDPRDPGRRYREVMARDGGDGEPGAREGSVCR